LDNLAVLKKYEYGPSPFLFMVQLLLR